MNNKAHLRPKDYDSNGDIIPMACKEEKGDLISRSALKKALHNFFDGKVIDEPAYILRDVFCYIESAPTVDIRNNGACEDCVYFDRPTTLEPCRNCTLAYGSCFKEKEKVKDERPQGKWIMVTEPDGFIHSKCSNCNRFNDWGDVPFCPWCGANMKGGAE